MPPGNIGSRGNFRVIPIPSDHSHLEEAQAAENLEGEEVELYLAGQKVLLAKAGSVLADL